MDSLQEALERIKMSGAYAVDMRYGEDVGGDDSMVQPRARRVRVSWYPVGHLGERKCLWQGKLADLLVFDPTATKPTVVTNPPGKAVLDKEGYWTWGADLVP